MQQRSDVIFTTKERKNTKQSTTNVRNKESDQREGHSISERKERKKERKQLPEKGEIA
jgi:hypothetical protein